MSGGPRGGAAPRRSVVVHGHFYQPPRENPWTGRVPREPSAAPFHDWNHRVHDECYRPVASARLLDDDRRIAGVVPALEWMSWDAGPTLLRWMARQEPETYRAFLEADARTVERTGHGNALACPYHHVILPLSSLRDKITEVRWGIADFRRRFGREPEGMWLPETAVDTETLEVLAGEGIRFTVLGPDQVRGAPEDGRAGRVELPGGASISVFVYDGGLSHDVAFGEVLGDAGRWVRRMADPEDSRRVVGLATDGETFGHHHRWGDLALAATLRDLRARTDVRLEGWGAALAAHPPRETVELVEPSSWSCAHGVGRWKEECGCRMDPSQPTQQHWRTVLRDALDELARDLHRTFQEEAGTLLADPWAARDRWGEVLDAGDVAQRRRVEAEADRPLETREVERARALLAMEVDALRMYTSCGWFFDDLAGLEPLQVLRYAAHALDLLGGADAEAWEARIRDHLADAESNDPEAGDGRRLWDERVRTSAAESDGPPARVEPASPARALLEAVQALRRDPTDETARRVLVLADGLEEQGHSLPYAASTALADRVGPNAPEPLRRAARRLGFADPSRRARASGGSVAFVLGLHVHQPVGNFDEVFRSHADDVYLRFLRRAADAGLLPLTLHVSGPLLSWLERHGHAYLDLVAELAQAGQLELLLSGFWEPVLPVLTREERQEQIGWMRHWLQDRLGVDATGLWLTERVWEPGLVRDLADVGVEYVFLDDRHFLVAGHAREELHRPWRTESEGRELTLLPIDERLRYLVPFRPADRLADYLRALGDAGHPMAVLADDGEKFGGWPGTEAWVWDGGWMDDFLRTMDDLQASGRVRLATPSTLLEELEPAGLTYLPSASYREMEGWSLPPDAAARMERLEAGLAEDDPARAHVRGGHWRSFLSRYPESNRMHKKAAWLSRLCREAGDPPGVRRDIGAAQCNDAYWHGVFGGLYLRHLRGAIWARLARAEARLREGQSLEVEERSLYAEGTRELLVHGEACSLVVRPDRGGSLSELTRFASERNLADVLTRRRESYHPDGSSDAGNPPGERASDDAGPSGEPPEGLASIHEHEEALGISERPPVDAEERALFVERVVPAEADAQGRAEARERILHSWAETPFEVAAETSGEDVLLGLRASAPYALQKEIRIRPDGTVEVRWRWDPADFPRDAWFTSESTVAAEVVWTAEPEPAAWWRFAVETVSKSEAGSERTVQGTSVTAVWPSTLGEARLVLGEEVG